MFGLLLNPAYAAFNPKHVAADAKWVVFLDFNELRDSALGKELMETVQKQMPAEFAKADLRMNWEKLLTTIGSVTAYGANFAPDPKMIDGTLIAQGAPELRKIAEALVLQATITSPKDVTEVTGLPFDAYALGAEVFVGFPKEPIVIVSKSKTQLVKAHDVFRGTVPSLAANASSPLRRMVNATERSYLVAASLIPTENKAFMEDGPQARIAQLLESGSLSIGENGPRTFANLQLNANNDDNAVKVGKIVEGMVAMLSLAETNDRNLAEFIRSANVQRKDRTVAVDLAYATDRLTQMIKSLQQAHPQTTARRAPAGSGRPVPGKAVAEWKLDQAAAGATTPAERLTTREVQNVRLVNNAIVNIVARADAGPGRALVDVIEVVPADGGTPLRFEAENMNLAQGGNAYRMTNAPYASGRRLLALNGSFGLASFAFPGADGNYTLRVHYVEEADAKSTLSVIVRDPVVPPSPK